MFRSLDINSIKNIWAAMKDKFRYNKNNFKLKQLIAEVGISTINEDHILRKYWLKMKT